VIRSGDVIGKRVERQCNCACSDSILLDDHITVFDPDIAYQLHPELRFFQLDATHQVVYVPPQEVGVNSIGVLNSTAWEILSAFAESSQCKERYQLWCREWGEHNVKETLNRVAELNFLHNSIEHHSSATERSEVLEAWLHITDRCNLRCHYCFLPHRPVDMSLNTGLASIDAIYRSALTHKFSRIKIKYAGGEATLCFPLLAELNQHAREKSEFHGIALEGVVLSNGTRITKGTIDLLQEQQLQLMISLDGLGEVQDYQRPYAGGHGSSKDVANSIDLALDQGLIPHISVTVSGTSVNGLPQLIEWILQRDLPFSINFYRENDFSTAYEDLVLNENRIIAGMLAAMDIIVAHLPSQSLLSSFIDLADLSSPHLRTCGVGHSYLVFDYLGRVSKCHMQMDAPITTFRVSDPLELIRADSIGVQNLSVEEKENCRTCEWRYWCSGGCPVTTYRATGRYDVKSPNCSIYRALYPEVIRLEGMRLLKWFYLDTGIDR
jgi:uncharacterized protein